ncbi:hypothetical protein HII13_002066 [Brettanomyces bruxellensis]|uniref:DEBR0S5_07228g1_1 n=1 Tax=Dekkera bruxellensis TaxID=5007 RepID=A0A7D9CZV9_DEKBR|nr:hypothetical protein HII13_002066 [Brettanomyces bruxellensis]VUG19611.1 DEBR0S5_07228g1_1 [Brettanomyces bruxellensis]
MSKTFCDQKAASNRTNFVRSDIDQATNTPELLPDLTPDSDSDYESDFELDSNFNYSIMANSQVSSIEKQERATLMNLIVRISSQEFDRRVSQISGNHSLVATTGTCSFLIQLIQRTKVSLNQFLANMVILDRLASNGYAISQFMNDHRKLILYSFLLGSVASDRTNSINFSFWSKVTGLTVNRLSTDLVMLGRGLGNLHTVKTVSSSDLQMLRESLKTVVKKHLKVIY